MTLIYMRNVEGQPDHRALTAPLVCDDEYIPIDFTWDGSSVPRLFQGFFPRHRHPVASCRHDFRCGRAKNKAERAYADKQFEIDVGKTSWKITSKVGYLGVRIGAFFGIGSNFK